MVSHVSNYQIILDRPNGVYWAGERITGVVKLSTSGPINCRAVKVSLQGAGTIHWHSGAGDDRKDYHGSRKYLRRNCTIWGNFYNTVVLDECGENAIFGVKTIGDGDLVVPLDLASMPWGSFGIGLRVMDYDWGKKDDLLGEVFLDPRVLLSQPGNPMSFPLTRNGKPEKGEVTLSATWEDHSAQAVGAVDMRHQTTIIGMSSLNLKIHKATGLRKADFFGKNDVYVQGMILPSQTDISNGLPIPTANMVLPKGDLVAPFSFDLPLLGIPSSFEHDAGDECFVRYSIYSNVDIAWNLDPSARRPITVISGGFPSPQFLAPSIRPKSEPQISYKCCCFCPEGTVILCAMVDRRALSPNDAFFVAASVVNNTENTLTLSVKLQQNLTMASRMGSKNHPCTEYILATEEVRPNSSVTWDPSSPKRCVVPMLPPSYNETENQTQGNADFHPLTWKYTLEICVTSGYFFKVPFIVPAYIGPTPAPLLQFIDPQNYGFQRPPAPIFINMGGEVPIAPQFAPLMFPPMPMNTNPLIQQQLAWQAAQPCGRIQGVCREEDMHPHSPIIEFTPSYPYPMQQSNQPLYPMPAFETMGAANGNSAAVAPAPQGMQR